MSGLPRTADGVPVDEALAHAGNAALMAAAGSIRRAGGGGRGAVPGLPTPHPMVDMLPGLLQGDDVSRRWVGGLDDVLAPILLTLDNLDAYLDPRTTPADWLPWLDQWVGLQGFPALDEAHHRQALVRSGELCATRGTAAGLVELVATSLRITVEVSDSGAASWSAAPGAPLPGEADPWVRVRVVGVEDGSPVDESLLRRVIADAVPAHARLDLDLNGHDRTIDEGSDG